MRDRREQEPARPAPAARPFAPTATAGLNRGSRRGRFLLDALPLPRMNRTEGGGDTDFIVGGGEKKGSWRERDHSAGDKTDRLPQNPQTERKELRFPFALKHT